MSRRAQGRAPPSDAMVDEIDEGDAIDTTSAEAWEGSVSVFGNLLQGIDEDSQGHLKNKQKEVERAKKREIRVEDDNIIEKGVIRYLYIILDMSEAMNTKDFRPTRFTVTLELVENFIIDYFDQNPLSQLGLITSYAKIANKITELSGNPKQQIEKLKDEVTTAGEMSLQNALEMAQRSLRDIPPYGCREILVVMGSLATCDPGDIFGTIKTLKDDNIQCSVINVAAELHVCKILTKATGGESHVPLNKEHFWRLLQKYLTPRPIRNPQSSSRKWIQMGFPKKKTQLYPSMCACHERFSYAGYICPKCASKYCEVPTDCKVCSLTLVSSPHLARSYHHLFPVKEFVEVKFDTSESPDDNTKNCFSCLKQLHPDKSLVTMCPKCRQEFCVYCDQHIHENLHNCPGCLSCGSFEEAYDNPEVPEPPVISQHQTQSQTSNRQHPVPPQPTPQLHNSYSHTQNMSHPFSQQSAAPQVSHVSNYASHAPSVVSHPQNQIPSGHGQTINGTHVQQTERHAHPTIMQTNVPPPQAPPQASSHQPVQSGNMWAVGGHREPQRQYSLDDLRKKSK